MVELTIHTFLIPFAVKFATCDIIPRNVHEFCYRVRSIYKIWLCFWSLPDH